jgi:hypothetical protein
MVWIVLALPEPPLVQRQWCPTVESLIGVSGVSNTTKMTLEVLETALMPN